MYKATITIRLRESILDPQGKAVQQALNSLGFRSVEGIRIGKLVEMNIGAETLDEASAIAAEACNKLLANPVMEDFEIEMSEPELV